MKNQVRALRIERGLAQGQLAEAMGVSRPPEQVPDLRDGQQLGIGAGRGGIRIAPDKIRS